MKLLMFMVILKKSHSNRPPGSNEMFRLMPVQPGGVTLDCSFIERLITNLQQEKKIFFVCVGASSNNVSRF